MNTEAIISKPLVKQRQTTVISGKAEKNTPLFRRIQGSVFLSGLSVFAQLYLFQPLLPMLCKSFAITPAESSLVISASTFGMAAGLFIYAFKADIVSRKQLMSFSLIASSILTILSAFITQFHLLVIVSFFRGMLLSGVSAVAMAYLSEEVSAGILGLAISLYLSGNAIGGMSGRMVVTLLAGWFGWHWAVFSIGIITLGIGFVFIRRFPPSRFFYPQKTDVPSKLRQMRKFMRDPLMLRLFGVIFFLMGCFVSVYNYIGFRLEAAPFSLPHYIIAFIFLMYMVGVAGSMVAGKWSDKTAPDKVLKLFIGMTALGLLLLLSDHIVLLVIGLGLFTFSFFGAHSVASRMVSQHRKHGKSTATSLYLLFYYVGSGILGTSTGVILFHWSWEVLMLCLMVLSAIAFILSSGVKWLHKVD